MNRKQLEECAWAKTPKDERRATIERYDWKSKKSVTKRLKGNAREVLVFNPSGTTEGSINDLWPLWSLFSDELEQRCQEGRVPKLRSPYLRMRRDYTGDVESSGAPSSSPPRHHATKKSGAQLQREIDATLSKPGSATLSKIQRPGQAHATKISSEAMVTRMIGRHVKSGWHGLLDGEIIQWEPFGAGGTDVLVKDATGHLSWYASHGLTPIDGKGPLPSRAEVRGIREAEMKDSMKKIGERWAKEPPPPRIRR